MLDPLLALGGGELRFKPGEGNLQLALLFASIVGPLRIAHGVKRAVRLEKDEAKKVSNNSSASRHVLYVTLYLPISDENKLLLTVGGEDTPGDNSGLPVELAPRIGLEGGVGFSAVLLPGETLYAISPLDCSFTVSEVSF